MSGERKIFLDTNILVRANVLTAPAHEQSIEVLRLLRKQRTALWISQQSIREYLAVVTRPQSFMHPLDTATAVSRARYFRSHFRVAPDNSLVLDRLLSLLTEIPTGGKQVHDANIVATMQAYGIPSLLTFNPEDFKRFAAHIKILAPETILKEDK